MTITKKPPTLSALADLPNVKTKAEFDIAEKRIAHEIDLETATLADLEKQREAALFTEGGDVIGISSSIVQCRDRIETLQAALVAVKERGVEIAKVEAAAEIEEWKVDAKVLAEQATAEIQRYVAGLEMARAANAIIDGLRIQIDRKNSYLQEAGVPMAQIKTFSTIKRQAMEGRASRLYPGLSEHNKPMDIHLHDLASNIRVDLPRHMENQRLVSGGGNG